MSALKLNQRKWIRGDDGELQKPDSAGARSAECFVASIKNEDSIVAETVQPPVPVKVVQNIYSVLGKMKSPANEHTQIVQTCANENTQMAQPSIVEQAQMDQPCTVEKMETTQPSTVDKLQLAQPRTVEKTQMTQTKKTCDPLISSSTPVSPKDVAKNSVPRVFIFRCKKVKKRQNSKEKGQNCDCTFRK